MSVEPNTIIKEIKTRVAKRVPKGDRWQPLDNTTLTLESLTECLEYIYQKFGNTQFFMDAREGYVYIVDTEEIPLEVIPEKKWSLLLLMYSIVFYICNFRRSYAEFSTCRFV